MKVTDRSFTYASPHLLNQLPSSFRQPHCVHSFSGSPHPAHITSSQSPHLTIYHSLSRSLHLFHKSFPPYQSIVIIIPPGLPSRVCTELGGHWRLFVLVSSFSFFTARCTLVQRAVLRSHVVCLSVRPSVRL